MPQAESPSDIILHWATSGIEPEGYIYIYMHKPRLRGLVVECRVGRRYSVPLTRNTEHTLSDARKQQGDGRDYERCAGLHLLAGSRVVEFLREMGGQGGRLALACMRQIHWETGPRRVAEAFTDTAQIRYGRGLNPACRQWPALSLHAPDWRPLGFAGYGLNRLGKCVKRA